MIVTIDPKSIEKPLARCSECDIETSFYNTFLSPTNGESVICSKCLARKEKGFNAKRGFGRVSRSGSIPR